MHSSPTKSKLTLFTILSALLLALSSCHSSRQGVKLEDGTLLTYEQLARAGTRLGMYVDRKDDLRLMVEASRWIGVPYQYGGTSMAGIDCSGLSLQIYRNTYQQRLHRSSRDQYSEDCRRISRRKLRSGDLVFFATGSSDEVSHVGVYLKDDRFIHASSSRGVIVSNLDERYYALRWVSGGRVKEGPASK